MASWRSSTTRAWRSTRLSGSRLRGCGPVSRRRVAGTRARCCPPWSALRRGVSALRRPSWIAPGVGTPSWRSGCGSWPPRARRGWASPGATRPSPPASALRSTSCCSSPAPPSPAPTTATARRRTRSPAVSRRLPRPLPRPTTRRPGARHRRASPAEMATRACCSYRAGTCACAAPASPPPRCAPSAPPRRTPRSTSFSPEHRPAGVAPRGGAMSRPLRSLRRTVPRCLQHVPARGRVYFVWESF